MSEPGEYGDAPDVMGYLVPADFGLDEWPEGLEDLPTQLARILDPEWTHD